MAFKPRKNYDLPPAPRDPNLKLEPNEHAYQKPTENKQVQQMNEYLLSRVNDPKYQKQLADNQYYNQVQNGYMNSKVLGNAAVQER